jgi:hypothetical protein
MTLRTKILPVLGAFVLLVAMGQGCAANTADDNSLGDNSPPVGDNANSGNDDSNQDGVTPDQYTADPCPTGTQRYVSTRINLTFCYPANVNNQAVNIDDSSNRITVRLGSEVIRVMSVVNVGQNANRNNTVLSYAADPADTTVTCIARSVEDNKGREAFILVGNKNNAQTQDALAACINSSKLTTALNSEPIGRFFFYDNEEELVLLSGSQDAPLGDLTDDFEATIWPRN